MRGHEHCTYCGKPVRWWQFAEYNFIHDKCEEKAKKEKAKSKVYKGDRLLREMLESCQSGVAKFGDLEEIYGGYAAAMKLLNMQGLKSPSWQELYEKYK